LSAFFGADLSQSASGEDSIAVSRFSRPEGLRVYQDKDNEQGCDPYVQPYPEGVLIARRGGCPFLDKLKNANEASAAGVIVISDEDLQINPTANVDELDEAGNLNDTALVLLTKTSGKALLEMIDLAELQVGSQVMVALHRSRQGGNSTDPDPAASQEDLPTPTEEDNRDPSERVLYINGHALLNTRLLV
jgi:mannosidase alpha-like ER degradation enhancer 1